MSELVTINILIKALLLIPLLLCKFHGILSKDNLQTRRTTIAILFANVMLDITISITVLDIMFYWKFNKNLLGDAIVLEIIQWFTITMWITIKIKVIKLTNEFYKECVESINNKVNEIKMNERKNALKCESTIRGINLFLSLNNTYKECLIKAIENKYDYADEMVSYNKGILKYKNQSGLLNDAFIGAYKCLMMNIENIEKEELCKVETLALNTKLCLYINEKGVLINLNEFGRVDNYYNELVYREDVKDVFGRNSDEIEENEKEYKEREKNGVGPGYQFRRMRICLCISKQMICEEVESISREELTAFELCEDIVPYKKHKLILEAVRKISNSRIQKENKNF